MCSTSAFFICFYLSLYCTGSIQGRAGKTYGLKKRFRFLGFLGSNVRTVARGTLDTGIRSRRRPIHED